MGLYERVWAGREGASAVWFQLPAALVTLAIRQYWGIVAFPKGALSVYSDE